MNTALLALLLCSAEPNPEQLELLKTFRGEFVELTPGEGKFPATFMFGEEPQSKAPAAFFMAKYEVPQNLWLAVMGSNPSKWSGKRIGGEWTGKRNSVEMLSLAEAQDFCLQATELMRTAGLIEKGQAIRLPTEAEWEYAARAGTTTKYSFGDDVENLGDYAWHTGNAAGNDPPVGAKKPNPWDLYDIHGYLWEWTSDDDAKTGTEPATAEKTAIVRGGSWKDKADALTSDARRSVAADFRDDAVGLRCVLTTER